MFKYRLRMVFDELKSWSSMHSDSSRRVDTGTDPQQTRMRGFTIGGCGWPQMSCSHQDDEEEYYGPRPRSSACEDKEGPKPQGVGGGMDASSQPSLSESGLQAQQCRICFQGPEKGESLSPCRCDGSVRCTHQSCLIRWISERGSWSCELCYFKYQVSAISTKNPSQWQAISSTVIERVQIAAIVSGSSFLFASISWLVWSSLSPSAKWQRQDLSFQICYSMYGFMDIVCVGLIIHEGSSVYRIFKRWRAVNQQWKVSNYEKAKDLGDSIGLSSKSVSQVERNFSNSIATNRQRRTRHVRAILTHQCGYTISHILSQSWPSNSHGANQEVVMRVTTV